MRGPATRLQSGRLVEIGVTLVLVVASAAVSRTLSAPLLAVGGGVAKRLDCYASMGYRAGGCSRLDARNHEIRLAGLEQAGYANYRYTARVGDQVKTLHEVAGGHQRVQERLLFGNRAGSEEMARQALIKARKRLHNFPKADGVRETAVQLWNRVRRPFTTLDWLQLVLAVGLCGLVVFKSYGCWQKRRRRRFDHSGSSVTICTNGQPLPSTATV